MANPGLQSIADLTASTCMTSGEIPPPLVGASTTVIGMRLYLFAGRLISSRKMTNDLYILDLESMVWTRHADEEERAPKPRYFHSANRHKNSVVFFGGMGYSGASGDTLCVLDDVSIFNLETNSWEIPEIIQTDNSPRPRYAHLAAVTSNKLVIIGGQDMSNCYIEEVNVLDLDDLKWTSSRVFEKHCGAYRSVAVSSTSNTTLIENSSSKDNISITSSLDEAESDVVQMLRKSSSQASITSSSASSATSSTMHKPPSISTFGSGSSLHKTPSGQNLARPRSIKRLQSSHRLSYSINVTDANPNPIYLYSNYNFTDVRRELQVIAPPTTDNYQIMDRSPHMSGAFLPPGLRFPTGAILGHHLIISGTYLTMTNQTFSIWALNLANLVWTRIDTGSCFTQGSWNRGVLCESINKYIVLGHRDRSLVDDYNHRQTNFEHVVLVDLEAFGVYQPPPATMAPGSQELGLALMGDLNLADFEILTIDNHRVPVNSRILAQRWPTFKTLIGEQAERAAELQYDEDLPRRTTEESSILMYKGRILEFPETLLVTVAFLQFLYTDHLFTAQQSNPHTLAQLLLLADMYDLDRLRQLATHALHQCLDVQTAALIYETAALSRQAGLQIRALRVMIAAKKMFQQQQQHRDSQMLTRHQINGTRVSLADNDLMSPSQWMALSSQPSPPLPGSGIALDPSRQSYFDPYNAMVPPPTNVMNGRGRLMSSVNAIGGTMMSRGYLPTIHDSLSSASDNTIVEDGSTPTAHIRSVKSNSSIKSSRSQHSFSTNNGYQGQDAGFSYVTSGLTNMG